MLLKIINKRRSEIKKKIKVIFEKYKDIGRHKSLVHSFDNLYLIVSSISI